MVKCRAHYEDPCKIQARYYTRQCENAFLQRALERERERERDQRVKVFLSRARFRRAPQPKYKPHGVPSPPLPPSFFLSLLPSLIVHASFPWREIRAEKRAIDYARRLERRERRSVVKENFYEIAEERGHFCGSIPRSAR